MSQINLTRKAPAPVQFSIGELVRYEPYPESTFKITHISGGFARLQSIKSPLVITVSLNKLKKA